MYSVCSTYPVSIEGGRLKLDNTLFCLDLAGHGSISIFYIQLVKNSLDTASKK